MKSLNEYKRKEQKIQLNGDIYRNSKLMNAEDILQNKFNHTFVDYPFDKTVIHLFEEQVLKTPEQTAVIGTDEILTYEELNRRANLVALKLRGLGIQPDDRVAIIIEPCIEMIVGIFGILKSGGAYVPIDMKYPTDRIQYMIDDSCPKVCLVSQKTRSIKFNTQAIILEIDDVTLYDGEAQNPEIIITGENLSSILYTSGTTGKPKGVMNKHLGLLNVLLWMKDKFNMNSNDCIIHKTTFTFDVSIWELIWWCISGAKVLLLPPDHELELKHVITAIIKHKVSFVVFVPSLLNRFLSYMEEHPEIAKQLECVRYVFSIGEPLPVRSLKKFNELVRMVSPNTKLINLYGPTEASIEVTYYECEHDYETLPIGKPIANTQIYIIKDNQLCDVGVPGELYIGGVSLAGGYLNKEEFTKERFIDNPFGEGKIYGTGDIAYWRADGNLEYMGRVDDQVQIMGIRIELNEIEETICEINDIKSSAVIVKNNGDIPALCAFYVSEDKIDCSKVRSFLISKLPEYMIPQFITQVDTIPVTNNGKLNKKQLLSLTA